MFQILSGDLLDTDAEFICHQVNCRNVMGAGVAKAIYTKYPEVKSEYHKFCSAADSPEKLLGAVQIVPIANGERGVINIFGQLDYGRKLDYYGRKAGTVYTDYRALEKAFRQINQTCSSRTLAFPYGFGCGLAGGDWEMVETIMLYELKDCDVTVYVKF